MVDQAQTHWTRPGRTYTWPKGHWDWPIRITHKHGLRCGDLVFAGGQIDVDPLGAVQHEDDMAAQAAAVVEYIKVVLAHLDARVEDLVRLVAFHADPEAKGTAVLIDALARALPPGARPVLSPVPVKFLAYPRMVVEIELVAYAPSGGAPAAVWGGDGRFAGAVRAGGLVIAGLATTAGIQGRPLADQAGAALAALAARLASVGSSLQEVTKLGCYVARDRGRADLPGLVAALSPHLNPDGVTLQLLPLPQLPGLGADLALDAFAMAGPRTASAPGLGSSGLLSGHFRNAVRVADTVFLGTQVPIAPGGGMIDGVVGQTHACMGHLRELLGGFGLGLDDIAKVNAFYDGDGTYDDLHKNLSIRSAYYNEPGPTTTGIPLTGLLFDGQAIQIDALATAPPA